MKTESPKRKKKCVRFTNSPNLQVFFNCFGFGFGFFCFSAAARLNFRLPLTALWRAFKVGSSEGYSLETRPWPRALGWVPHRLPGRISDEILNVPPVPRVVVLPKRGQISGQPPTVSLWPPQLAVIPLGHCLLRRGWGVGSSHRLSLSRTLSTGWQSLQPGLPHNLTASPTPPPVQLPPQRQASSFHQCSSQNTFLALLTVSTYASQEAGLP